MVFGVVAMFGSVILLTRTLLQTLKQMTSEAPEGSHEQVLQVVVSVLEIRGCSSHSVLIGQIPKLVCIIIIFTTEHCLLHEDNGDIKLASVS